MRRTRPGPGLRSVLGHFSVSLCSSLIKSPCDDFSTDLGECGSDSTTPWPSGIIFQFTACAGSVVPTQWSKPQWPQDALWNACVFHLYQECHMAFPDCTSSLPPHLSFQTKYQGSSHMCLWYIINLYLS